jgi:hypothetical protein
VRPFWHGFIGIILKRQKWQINLNAYPEQPRASGSGAVTDCFIDPVVNGRSRTEVNFKAIRFSALSRPSFAQGSHNDHGGNRNQPPSASPMIAAVPFAASAAVNRQMSAAA